MGLTNGTMLAGLLAVSGFDIDSVLPKQKTSWKETQPESDKNHALQKASLKRYIKALKKQKNYDKQLLLELQKEYREM